MTTSDPFGYSTNVGSPKLFGDHLPLAELRSQTTQVSRTTERSTRMSGRPTATESRQRQSQFLSLVAGGMPADAAAREANIGPWKALRIVSEASFNDVVRAIREGAGPVSAVVDAAETDGKIAA